MTSHSEAIAFPVSAEAEEPSGDPGESPDAQAISKHARRALRGRGYDQFDRDPQLAAWVRTLDPDIVCDALRSGRHYMARKQQIPGRMGQIVVGQRSADEELTLRKPHLWTVLLQHRHPPRLAHCAAMVIFWDFSADWEPEEIGEWWEERFYIRPQPEASAAEVGAVLLDLGYTRYRVQRRLRIWV